MEFVLLLLLVVLLLFLATDTFKIVAEDERLAAFTLGRFAGFRGPGLVLKSLLTKSHKLKIGDTGVVSSEEFIRFDNVEIPMQAQGHGVGDSVRIVRFDGTEPVLSATAEVATRTCPNCGHEFV